MYADNKIDNEEGYFFLSDHRGIHPVKRIDISRDTGTCSVYKDVGDDGCTEVKEVRTRSAADGISGDEVFSMDQDSGMTLRQYMREEMTDDGSVESLQRSIVLFRKILKAAEPVAGIGICHGDIRPENIYLRGYKAGGDPMSAEPVILDMGTLFVNRGSEADGYDVSARADDILRKGEGAVRRSGYQSSSMIKFRLAASKYRAQKNDDYAAELVRASEDLDDEEVFSLVMIFLEMAAGGLSHLGMKKKIRGTEYPENIKGCLEDMAEKHRKNGYRDIEDVNDALDKLQSVIEKR